MRIEKMTTGMSYAALGAIASYLIFWWSGNGSPHLVLSMLFALTLALTGYAMLVRSGKRSGHREPAERRNSWPANVEARPKAAARASEADRIKEEERNGEAALFGHEMKNYLCTLRGNAKLLRQRVKGDDNDIIDRIDRVVEKLESFTHNKGSAPDATGSQVLWGVRLGDAAKACVKTHFHGNDDSFKWEVQDDAPTLLGDPDRLEQVFLNLYSNSLEAGALNVSTKVRRDGRNLQVRIEDDGKGCAPEDVERIFEPFFTTKSGPARRGLGMFIVQSIVENHGGKIKVGSKNRPDGGHGLVFTLEFPISEPAPIPDGNFGMVPALTGKVAQKWLLALPEPF